jgi:hypothetical protein
LDARIAKWTRWLDQVHEEVVQLAVARDIFWSVQRLIRENEDLRQPSSFFRYLGDTYISHVLMGIRRQAKSDNRSISLARLLAEIADDHTRLSRKAHKALYESAPDLADSTFDHFCDRPGAEFLSKSVVLRDIEEMKSSLQTCEKFADKRIAHRDRKDPKKVPKFSDVDQSIDVLDRLYCKYLLLLRAHSMETVMPVYQYDWQVVFDVAWRKAAAESNSS